MKSRMNRILGLFLAVTALIGGCSAPRVVERDRYFKPVVRRVQPLRPSAPTPAVTAAPDPSLKVLEGGLAESRRELLELRLELMSVRDSIRIIGVAARLQDQFTRSLVDKLATLEQRLLTAEAVRPPQVVPQAPAPLAEVRPKPTPSIRPKSPTSMPTIRPGMTLAAEYSEAVRLFNRKQYDDARAWFSRLLEMGISEDLADNCEYWVGECDFARGRWTSAVESFDRVLALRGSNKRPDAMLMLGRSLEQLRQSARARSMYEQLIREYPSSSAAATARWKLRTMRSQSEDRTDGPVIS